MPDRAPKTSPRAFRRLAGALLLVLAVAGVVVAAAVALTARQTPLYTSTSVVLIELDATGVTRAPAMGTEREVATSLLVAESAARGLDADPEELLRALTVTVPVDTNVLHFTFDAHTPETARATVSAFVNAYVNYRSSGAFVGPRVPAVNAAIISPADLPREPSKPNWLVNLATAVLLGLCLGLAAGYRPLAAALRSGPLPEAAGVDHLAVVPAAPLISLARGGEPPRDLEPYRRLRTHVLTQLGDSRPVPALLVASPYEGRETLAVALQLGAALVQSGHRTVVIALGSDERLPQVLGVDAAPGLSDRLRTGGSARDVLIGTSVSGLSVLPPGTDGRTSDVLARFGLDGVLLQLADVADFVLVEAGSVLWSATALESARAVPAALLVVDKDEAAQGVRTAAAELRRAGTRVLGTVVAVRPDRKARRRAEHAARTRPVVQLHDPSRGPRGVAAPAPPAAPVATAASAPAPPVPLCPPSLRSLATPSLGG